MAKKFGRCPECGRQVQDIAGARPLTPLSPVGRTEHVQARPMEWQVHPCGHWVNSEQGGLISTGTTPTQTRAQREASSQAVLDAIDGAKNGRQVIAQACKAGIIPESWLDDLGMPLGDKAHAEKTAREAEEAVELERDEAMAADFKREEDERLAEQAALETMAEILGVSVERVRDFVDTDIPTMDIAVERVALDKIIPKIKEGTGLVPGSTMAEVIMQKKDANDKAIQKLREEMGLQELAKPRRRKIRRPK